MNHHTRKMYWWRLLPLLILPGFFISFEVETNVHAWHALMDLSHLPIFALLAEALLTLLQYYRVRHALRIALLSCLTLMLLVEWLQPMLGRTASMQDLLFGVVGLVLWGLWKRYWHRLRRVGQRLAFLIALLLIVLLCAQQPLTAWYAVVWRAQQLPQLGDFEQAIELQLWQAYGVHQGLQASASRSRDQVRHGDYALQVKTVATAWSGVKVELGDMDWSAYQSLHFSIYNPGERLTLRLRLDDDGDSSEYALRVNRALRLRPGWNEFEFALSDLGDMVKARDFNFHRVRRLYLYVPRLAQTKTFYVDHVYLQ